MNSNNASASKASINNKAMAELWRWRACAVGRATDICRRKGPCAARQTARSLAALGLALGLAACGTPGPAHGPAPGPAPAPRPGPSAVPAPTPAPSPAPSSPAAGPSAPDGPAQWVKAEFAELPGWTDDRAAEVWPALLSGCARPAAVWRELCARAALQAPTDDADARRLLQSWLQPWRLQSARDGRAEGLATGYFEPQLDAVRQRREGFEVALHAPPADLATRRPHFSRQELETLPAAQASVAGRELAWIQDPVDLMMLQIQGSGRLRWLDTEGRPRVDRVAFAGHNAQTYRSPGRWLLEQGELRGDSVSWGAIRAWALKNPQRRQEMLWANPRVVYFRLEPLPDPNQGPRGAQGVPLTPMRSVAVDPRAVPYGSPMWISTRDPLADRPLQRLVMAQDTGTAIVGPVRIDLFTGWGDDALVLASRLKEPLRAWVLWPRDQALPANANSGPP